MMDRFKLRVWDKRLETYSVIPYGNYALSDDGELFWLLSNCDCSELNTEDYIVEQCTGLKDKNGKLIFEGDIVQTEDQTIGAVKFGEYGGNGWEGWHFGFYIDWIKNRQFKRKPTLRKDFWFWIENRELEVIGNVHKNQELLK